MHFVADLQLSRYGAAILAHALHDTKDLSSSPCSQSVYSQSMSIKKGLERCSMGANHAEKESKPC